MEFRELRYLLTVSKYGNITKAAQELYITQSALSLFIQKVEANLGIRIFDRSTSPLKLTAAGECYMESARKILQEQEKLDREIRDITQHMTGRLVMGTSVNRAAYEIPRIISQFQKKYPGITLKIITSSAKSLLNMLRSGEIDLLLLPYNDSYDMTGLEAELLYSEELVFAAAKKVMTPEMYADEFTASKTAMESLPFFALNQHHASRVFCEDYFKKKKIHPTVSMEFDSSLISYHMAAEGMGFAVVPYLITRLSSIRDNMVLLSLGKEKAIWKIYMFYRKGEYLGQPEKDLLEIARRGASGSSL